MMIRFATAALLTLSLCGAAHAQGAAAGDPSGPEQRMQAIAEELQRTEQAVLADNPELATQRDAFQALLRKTMTEKGADPEKAVARLAELQREAQGGNLSEERQQAMAQEFRDTRLTLMAARQAALEDDAVATAGQTFQQNLLTAMAEQNPDTPALIDELQQIQQQMQAQFNQQRGGQ